MTSSWVVLPSAAVAVAMVLWTRSQGMGTIPALLVSATVFTLFQAGLDLGFRRVYRNASTGLVFERGRLGSHLSIGRSLIKLGGLYATVGILAGIYLSVPYFRQPFFAPFWEALRLAGPVFAAISVPYFIVVDALMTEPRDGYWHMAQFVGLQWRRVDWRVLSEHAKGWVIKGFFLPLMVPLLGQAMQGLWQVTWTGNFVATVYGVSAAALCVDLAFVVVGYTFTIRVLDSHIRDANPYVVGWIACLILYRPFWGMVGAGYSDGTFWYHWLYRSPGLLYAWGAALILTKIGWAWSNAMFGFRFSNLTHRGIITSGPYRWTKHPSYLFKNIGWWLLYVPFLPGASLSQTIRNCLVLCGVNFLYLVRARTEEMHLSEDPTYVAYACWINERGILRWAGRIVPFLRYDPPRAPAELAPSSSVENPPQS